MTVLRLILIKMLDIFFILFHNSYYKYMTIIYEYEYFNFYLDNYINIYSKELIKFKNRTN